MRGMKRVLVRVAAAAAVGLSSCGATAALSAVPAPVHAIDEGAFVAINGIEQWITIRGRDRTNPILLFLHGGPGIGSASTAPIFAEWEKYFTIVQWDQPGGGATDIRNIGRDQGPMTVARYTRDGLAVTEYALRRLKARKLVLLGSSWGTLIGVEMAQAKPELFSAYVGTSQAVGARGNRLGWELAIAAARARGDTKAVEALETVGPPPYKTIQELLVRQTYVFAPGLPMAPAEQAAMADYLGVVNAPAPPGAHYVPALAVPPDYNAGAAFIGTQMRIFEETWRWEARHLGTRFAMPVFIFQGGKDLNTPVLAAREYYDEISAPRKAFEVIPDAGHNIIAFHAEILALLRKDVLPAIRTR